MWCLFICIVRGQLTGCNYFCLEPRFARWLLLFWSFMLYGHLVRWSLDSQRIFRINLFLFGAWTWIFYSFEFVLEIDIDIVLAMIFV